MKLAECLEAYGSATLLFKSESTALSLAGIAEIKIRQYHVVVNVFDLNGLLVVWEDERLNQDDQGTLRILVDDLTLANNQTIQQLAERVEQILAAMFLDYALRQHDWFFHEHWRTSVHEQTASEES